MQSDEMALALVQSVLGLLVAKVTRPRLTSADDDIGVDGDRSNTCTSAT